MPELLKSILSVVFMLICFAGVLFLAYYCTRLIGKRYNSNGKLSGNIKVLDRLSLSQNQSLLIVEAGDKTLLLGCTAHEITALSQLDRDALCENEQQPIQSFAQIFKKASHSKSFSEQNRTEGTGNNEKQTEIE